MSSNKLLKNASIAIHMYLSFHLVEVGGWKLNFFKLYRYQYYYLSKCFINNCWKKRLTDLRNQNIGTESLCIVMIIWRWFEGRGIISMVATPTLLRAVPLLNTSKETEQKIKIFQNFFLHVFKWSQKLQKDI